MISRNDLCWCGSGRKWKKCHAPIRCDIEQIQDPEKRQFHYLNHFGIILKTPSQIAGISEACRVTAAVLEELCRQARAGVSTQDLDDFAVELIRKAGATAAPLGYGSPPFPKSICTSINEEICHGIPGPRKLVEGDILNIDVSCIVDGFFGDCSKMVSIGEIDTEKANVVETAYVCLMESIEILKPGIPIQSIGQSIEAIAAMRGCSVVNQFVGHGVGLAFHEAPEIPHHKNHSTLLLAPGMTFTIEPMINAGVREAVIDTENHWTAYTKDRKPSAQWEHTVLITETGHKILTTWSR